MKSPIVTVPGGTPTQKSSAKTELAMFASPPKSTRGPFWVPEKIFSQGTSQLPHCQAVVLSQPVQYSPSAVHSVEPNSRSETSPTFCIFRRFSDIEGRPRLEPDSMFFWATCMQPNPELSKL